MNVLHKDLMSVFSYKLLFIQSVCFSWLLHILLARIYCSVEYVLGSNLPQFR